ncbi:MAG TPA: hypothetical protein VGD71_35525 [Kribbella sp.]|jgi:hypothetical protein
MNEAQCPDCAGPCRCPVGANDRGTRESRCDYTARREREVRDAAGGLTDTRGAAVPVFVCARPGELYEFIQDELAIILDQSRLT